MPRKALQIILVALIVAVCIQSIKCNNVGRKLVDRLNYLKDIAIKCGKEYTNYIIDTNKKMETLQPNSNIQQVTKPTFQAATCPPIEEVDNLMKDSIMLYGKTFTKYVLQEILVPT